MFEGVPTTTHIIRLLRRRRSRGDSLRLIDGKVTVEEARVDDESSPIGPRITGDPLVDEWERTIAMGGVPEIK